MILLSLPTRLFSGFAVLVLVFSGVQLYGLRSLNRTSEEFQILKDFHLNFIFQIQSLETSQSSLILLLKSLTESTGKSPRKTELLKRWIVLTRDKRDRSFRKLEKMILYRVTSVPGREKEFVKEKITPLIEAISKDIKDLTTRFNELLTTDTDSPQARLKYISRREQVIMSKIKKMVTVSRSRIMTVASVMEKSEKTTMDSQIFLLIISLFISLLVIYLSSIPLKYLKNLAAAVGRIGKGDLSVQVKVNSDDEIGTLAREFNRMAKAIEERENRLIQTERLATAGKLASQIAHEIRNPLAAVSFQVDLLTELVEDLSEESQGNIEIIETLQALGKEVDRLSTITDGYLQFARAPKMTLTKVNIIDLLNDFLDFIEGDLALSNIVIVRDLNVEDIFTPADENLLRQVLMNLIRNAGNAMENGGEIVVSCRADKQHIKMQVKDTGEGIPEKIQGKIFDAFFTTRRSGTGLGLALSKQIIEDHRGTITVASSASEGTVFTILLPVYDEI